MESTRNLIVEHDGRTAHVTLNRPRTIGEIYVLFKVARNPPNRVCPVVCMSGGVARVTI